MSHYTTKPERVEAIRFDAANGQALAVWTGGIFDPDEEELRIPTIHGLEGAKIGTYIVKDENGRFSTMPADRFEEKYHKDGVRNLGIQSEEDLQAVHQRRSFPIAG